MDSLQLRLARSTETLTRYGIALPIVDFVNPEHAQNLGCDPDLLCKWLVDHHGELSAFEVIIEDVAADQVTVLFAGMTKGGKRRFHERRLIVALEDDVLYYSERVGFSELSSELVNDESDLVMIRTPRWVGRAQR